MSGRQDPLLALLRQMRSEAARNTAELRSEVRLLRIEVGSGLRRLEAAIDGAHKDLSEPVLALRRATTEFRAEAIRQGILISDLEGRLLRVERRLNRPSLESP